MSTPDFDVLWEDLAGKTARLRRVIGAIKKGLEAGETILPGQKAHVIAIMFSLVSFVRENTWLKGTMIKLATLYAWSDAMDLLGIEKGARMSLEDAARDKIVGIEDLEQLGGIPVGTAEQPRCGVCGRPLTSPESIQRGIGPECLRKYRI